MRTVRAFVGLLSILVICTFLFAHDHKRVTGIITMVDCKDMEIKLDDGSTDSILLRSTTKYFKGKAKATASDLTAGCRVEVEVIVEADRLVAHIVRIGVGQLREIHTSPR